MYSFEELETWKTARQYRLAMVKTARSFPAEEKYRLTDQLIRSARSITNNIAEGFGRFHHQENIQFCRISRGSLFETLDHLICAADDNYITEEELIILKEENAKCLRVLNGYISYLKKVKQTITK
ncbi:MAG TPA: four helix bundle protein [Sphingobacteriaceae bacterium]|nr:four helix bundle protein [Sphingobacteriaceae bacterium]